MAPGNATPISRIFKVFDWIECGHHPTGGGHSQKRGYDRFASLPRVRRRYAQMCRLSGGHRRILVRFGECVPRYQPDCEFLAIKRDAYDVQREREMRMCHPEAREEFRVHFESREPCMLRSRPHVRTSARPQEAVLRAIVQLGHLFAPEPYSRQSVGAAPASVPRTASMKEGGRITSTKVKNIYPTLSTPLLTRQTLHPARSRA